MSNIQVTGGYLKRTKFERAENYENGTAPPINRM